MFDFVIFIAANRNGKVTADQKNQLNILIGALTDRRIHLRWIVPDARISVLSIARILRTAHFACRKKGVLVHNEIMTDGKSITKFASGVLKILPVDTRSEESVMRNDVCCLQNGNAPTGCSFHSCLGNVLLLREQGALSVCPRLLDVQLEPLREKRPINSVFDTDAFKALLLRQIQKRNRCRQSCALYKLCRGGCSAFSTEQQCSIQQKVTNAAFAEDAVKEQKIKRLSGLYKGYDEG